MIRHATGTSLERQRACRIRWARLAVLLAGGASACSTPAPGGAIRPPDPLPAHTIALPTLRRLTLDNGLSVLLIPERTVPLVTVHLMVRTGTIDDPPTRAGRAELALQLLRHGTRALDAERLTERLDTAGVRLGTAANYELSHITCDGRRRYLDLCLEIVAQMASAATFPAAEVDRARRELIAEAQESRDDPATLAELHFDNLLFGDDHPYGRAADAASLRAVDRADLRSYYERFFVPGAAALAVTGNFDPDIVARRLAARMSSWKARPVPRRRIPPLRPARPGTLLLIDKPDLTQSFFALGHPGISRTDPRRDAVRLLNHVLSGLRLSKVVRSRAGKTYSIRSRFDVATDDGSFIVKSFTRHEQLVSTLALVRSELARIRRQPPRAAEISAAKGRLAGGYAIRFNTMAALAAALMQARLFGLPERYVADLGRRLQQVTPAQIAAVAALVDPEQLIGAIVTRAAAVEPALRRAGIHYRKISYLASINGRTRRAEARAAAVLITDAEQAAARTLLQRALEATGATRPRARLHLEGTMEILPDVGFESPPLRGNFVLDAQPPDQLSLQMQLTAVGTALQMASTQQLRGTRAYLTTQGRRRELPPQRTAKLRAALWRQPVFVVRNALAHKLRARPLPPSPTAPELTAVEVFPADQPPLTLVFEGPLQRLVQLRYRDDRGQLRVTSLSDHRRVAGVLVPFRTVTRRGKRVQTTIVERASLR